MSTFKRTKLNGKIERKVGNICARKKGVTSSRYAKFWNLNQKNKQWNPQRLAKNLQLIFNNWKKTLYEMVQKIGRKCPEKLLSKLYMGHFKLCTLLMQQALLATQAHSLVAAGSGNIAPNANGELPLAFDK